MGPADLRLTVLTANESEAFSRAEKLTVTFFLLRNAALENSVAFTEVVKLTHSDKIHH